MLCVMLVLAAAYTLTTGCATAIVADHLIARGREDELTRVSAVSRVVFYCCYGLSALAAGLLAEVGYGLVFALSLASLAGRARLRAPHARRSGGREGRRARAPVRPLDAARYVAGCRPVLYYVLVEGAVAWSMVPVDDFYNNYLNGYFGVPLPAVGRGRGGAVRAHELAGWAAPASRGAWGTRAWRGSALSPWSRSSLRSRSARSPALPWRSTCRALRRFAS